jgi:ELWxxDGT repeat protein
VRATPMMTTQLWRTDGTAAGSRVVADGWSAPLVATDALVFSYSIDVAAPLLRSDGTAAGTFALATLPGPVRSVRATASRLYLQVDHGSRGELWTSDGTAAGTFRVLDLGTGTALALSGNNACFLVHDGLACADLALGAEVSYAPTFSEVDAAGDLVGDGQRLVFGGDEGDGFEPQLFAPDGASHQLADLAPPASSSPSQMISSGGEVYFKTSLPPRLGHSDGSRGGTALLPGPVGDAQLAAVPGGRLWALAGGVLSLVEGGVSQPRAGGPEQPLVEMATAGDRALARTADGVAVIAHADGASGSLETTSRLGAMALTAGPGYACTSDKVVRIDDHPSPDGEAPDYATVEELPGPRCVGPLVAFGDAALSWGIELMRFGPSDYELLSNKTVDAIDAAGPVAYFVSGATLYRTDGSAAGTRPAGSRPEASELRLLGRLGGTLLFADRVASLRPWTVWAVVGDGEPVELGDVTGEPSCYRESGGFGWTTEADGSLWRIESEPGPQLILRPYGRLNGIDGCELAVAGDWLLYRGSDPGHGRELWSVELLWPPGVSMP